MLASHSGYLVYWHYTGMSLGRALRAGELSFKDRGGGGLPNSNRMNKSGSFPVFAGFQTWRCL